MTKPFYRGSERYSNFPSKASTNFGYGLMVGAGLILICVGAFTAFWLNGFYWRQYNYLASNGLSPATLIDVSFLIGLSVLLAAVGAYLLIWGVAYQFSPSLRMAVEKHDKIAAVGNGLISGGFVFTVLSSLDLLQQAFSSYHTTDWFTVALWAILVTGLFMLILGGFLVGWSSHKYRLPTKV